jgi:hypothetical protein
MTNRTGTYWSYESHRSYSFSEPLNVFLRTAARYAARTLALSPLRLC